MNNNTKKQITQFKQDLQAKVEMFERNTTYKLRALQWEFSNLVNNGMKNERVTKEKAENKAIEKMLNKYKEVNLRTQMSNASRLSKKEQDKRDKQIYEVKLLKNMINKTGIFLDGKMTIESLRNSALNMERKVKLSQGNSVSTYPGKVQSMFNALKRVYMGVTGTGLKHPNVFKIKK